MAYTKADVEAMIARLNRGWTEPEELSFECWGTKTNRYRLVDESGKTYGEICQGAREFIKFLQGFEEGRRL